MEKAETFFQIRKDFTGVNQAGQPVKLSDLKGKVWLVAEFFAVKRGQIQEIQAVLFNLPDAQPTGWPPDTGPDRAAAK